MRPWVDPACAADNRHKENEHQWQSSRGCLEHAPNNKSPASASQVLQHQERKRADGDSCPKGKSKKVRMKKLGAIPKKSDHKNCRKQNSRRQQPPLKPGYAGRRIVTTGCH